MKNFEKYKTPEEAFKAQVRFCQTQSKDEVHCHKNGCKYSTGTTPCLLQWLYDEAEDELLPCPFCGGEAILHGSAWPVWVHCAECNMLTPYFDSNSEAIEKWNRRVNNG